MYLEVKLLKESGEYIHIVRPRWWILTLRYQPLTPEAMLTMTTRYQVVSLWRQYYREVKMKLIMQDYSIFGKFYFERKPVGIKFLPYKPEGIDRLSKSLYFCQMFKEAQTSKPFYVQREDFHCTEPLTLGMEDPDPILLSGLVGETDDLYEELRANQKIYQLVPRMLKGSVKCVLFSAIDQMTYDPDVLIITADNVDQARIIMRALVYSTG